jgi:hypothetical protein
VRRRRRGEDREMTRVSNGGGDKEETDRRDGKVRNLRKKYSTALLQSSTTQFNTT